VNRSEAALMLSAISPQALSLPVTSNMKDAFRAKILKSMLLEVARKSRNG